MRWLGGPKSAVGASWLRHLRKIPAARRVFFAILGRSYASYWDAFGVMPSLAREAILAGKGDDEEEFWASGRRDAERLVLPHLRQDATVLDLGCGIGRIARWVAPHCHRVIAVDVSPRMLMRARKNLREHTNITFVRCSGHSLATIDESSIDLAYSILVLQHLEREDVVRYLFELQRVIRPRGLLRIQLPNLAFGAQMDAFLRYSRTAPSRSMARVRYYTAAEVKLILNAAGFVVDEMESGESHFVVARRRHDS